VVALSNDDEGNLEFSVISTKLFLCFANLWDFLAGASLELNLSYAISVEEN
jgi:hypothetical protein